MTGMIFQTRSNMIDRVFLLLYRILRLKGKCNRILCFPNLFLVVVDTMYRHKVNLLMHPLHFG